MDFGHAVLILIIIIMYFRYTEMKIHFRYLKTMHEVQGLEAAIGQHQAMNNIDELQRLKIELRQANEKFHEARDKYLNFKYGK